MAIKHKSTMYRGVDILIKFGDSERGYSLFKVENASFIRVNNYATK